MRVLRDVVIQRTDDGGLQALSQQGAIAGEEMTLDLMGAGERVGLRVKVIDSRPVMVEGAVRHRIRLTLLSSQQNAEASSAMPAAIQAEAV
jgi:hypothetical protein